MNQPDQIIYDALKSHVTGLFRIYADFDANVPFHIITSTGIDLVCEVVDRNVDIGYSEEYVPIYIVFKVGVLYFKIEGYKDSYGGLEWDNYLTEVSRKEKVVYLYE